MKWMRIIVIMVVLGVVYLIGRQIAGALYFDERAQLQEQIERARTALATIRAAQRDEYPPVQAELQDIVDRTLGPSAEVVEAELRARLNGMVSMLGLQSSTVSTGRNAALSSPARRRMRRDNPLKDQADFVEQEATVSAIGTLDQAMQLVDAIQRAPWIMRINSIDLDPKQSPEHLSITLRMTTLYIPGRAPRNDSELVTMAPSQYDRVATFVAARPFQLPAPPAVENTTPAQPEAVAQATEPVKPPAPTFPYSDWRITGVVQGTQGMECWLLHARSSKSRTLTIGDKIGAATFVDASPEEAEFTVGEERFVIRVGSTLNDRVPVTPGT